MNYPSRRYAYYVIGVLTLITLSSLLDRNLTALFIQPIRNTLHISDTEVSLIHGSAFAILFAVMGIPFGNLVDRTNRRNLIAVGAVVWSVMTIYCGFADSFWTLFLGRMGVGIGEACLAPAAYSLIADYVDSGIRGRALSIYYSGQILGAGASLLLGGAAIKMLPKVGVIHLPSLGDFAPWQLVFVLAGVPGLFIVPILATVREAARRENSLAASSNPKGATTGEFLAHLRTHASPFASVYGCYALVSYVCLAALGWAPTFYVRHFGLSLPLVGLFVGLSISLGGLLGSVLSGILSDLFFVRQYPGRRFRVALVAWILFIPVLAAWTFVPQWQMSMAMFALLSILIGFSASSAPSTIQDMVPGRMRGRAIAIYLLIGSITGTAFGPTAVALLTDHLFHDDAALPSSLALATVPACLLGLLVAWRGLKSYDVASAAQQNLQLQVRASIST